MKSTKKNVLKPILFVCLGLAITTIAFTYGNQPTVPDSPGLPYVTDIRTDGCDLKWRKPKYDGGSPITGYIIQCTEGFFSRWYNKGTARPSELIYKVNGMQEGKEASFRVSAENEFGMSNPSDASDYITFRDGY